MSFSKQEYLDYTISKIAPSKSDIVLEVAAGTCICGRAIAPYAQNVTCLDMTPAMLTLGKAAAEKEHLSNMSFVLGDAAELPFLDNSFDIVFSRLTFHHFPDVLRPFSEMVRVLKHGGKLVVIDMEATEENLRETEDKIEKMRDPSHVRNLSKDELLTLYKRNDLSLDFCETVNMPIILQNWMEHTETSLVTQSAIIAKMKDDIQGGMKTGFHPYVKNSQILFNQRWMLIVGQKRN